MSTKIPALGAKRPSVPKSAKPIIPNQKASEQEEQK
jgi:hypothetical protein